MKTRAQTVTYTAPTGTDNCSGATTTLIGGLGSGSSYPKGVTTNTFRVTDAAGNTATCSFTVTVTDNQAPAITCPANIGVNVAAGTCAQTVTYTAPTGTDNCSGASTTLIGGLGSGSSFPTGVTTNTYRVTDAAGLTSTCSFTVTVTDNQAPAITCPANIGVNVAAGTCAQTVTYTAPTGTDNCSGAATTQIAGSASGSSFPKGVTTNTFRVTDAAGLTATCSFTVTVTDNQAPAITCPANIGVNVAAGTCAQTVTYTAPTGTDNCPGATTTQIAGLASAASYPKGVTTNTFRVTDAAGLSSTCSFTVTVTDNEAPSITCPANIAVNVAAGTCAQTATYTAPTGTDNCPGATTAQIAGLASAASYPKGVTTNTFRVTDAAGLSSTCSFTVTVTDNEAPSISCPANIAVNVAAGTCAQTVTYTAPTGTDNCPGATTAQIAGLASGASYPKGATTNTFRVTDAAGLSSTCSFTVTVTDNEAPSITCPANIAVNVAAGTCAQTATYTAPTGTDNCPGATTAQIAGLASGASYPKGTTTNTFRVTDAVGQSNTCSFTVTVTDNEAPVVTCPANISVNNDLGVCGASVTYSISSSDNCPGQTVAQTGGQASASIFPIGTTTNSFTVTDAVGLTSTCSFTVSVADAENPTITCPAPITVNAASGICSAVVTYTAPVGADNCSGQTTAQTAGLASGASYAVGTTTNTFTVTDASGNKASCSFAVTVIDNQAPVITTCPLDKFTATSPGTCLGNVSIGALSATDNCSVQSISNSFNNTSDASGLYTKGLTVVTWTVTDVNGNTSTCETSVYVYDAELPVAACKNVTLQLNGSSFVSITPSTIDNGSTDNCTLLTGNSAVSQTTFTCSNIGANTVTLTVIDNSGNTGTCNATVTIVDNVAPTAICQNITVPLDANGNVTITASQVNNGSNDACGIQNSSLNISSFSCANLGSGNTVVLTVSDYSGNASTCSATVTVIDNIKPTAVCNNFTVALNNSGNATVTGADFSGASTDNCGITSRVVNPSSFTCANLGTNPVTVILSDQSGNTDFCTPTVTVVDNTAPSITCPANIAVNTDAGQCGALVTFAASATDNCTLSSLVQTGGAASGTQFPVGLSTISYKATDQSGNTSTCSFTIAVTDIEKPTAVCQNVIVSLNNAGNGTTSAAAVNNGSSDACGVQSLALSNSAFTCANVGANTVILTVTDNNGNTKTCSATVTVQDNVAPVALCKNVSVTLVGASGSTTAAAVNNGSSDACGVQSLSLSQTTFTCANVGANAVVLTVTDVNGNSSTCGATVTVTDNTAPAAICKNITVQLNAAGTASITGADVNNNSTDACGIASLAAAPNTFNCSNVTPSAPTELFISEYVEGSSNIKYLEIYNGTANSVNLGNYTLRNYANGSTTVTSSNVLSGSLASGAVVVYKNSLATGYAGPATALAMMTFNGNDAVALYNNSTSQFCDIIGNIGDDPGSAWTAPGLSTVDRTLRRKPSVNKGVTVDPTGTGASSFTTLATEWDGFATDDVSGLGSHAISLGTPVVLTVTDVNGNSSTCSATVKVEDKVAPTALCKNINLPLNASGNATIVVNDLDNGSSDACGISTRTISKASFNCSNVGANSVVLTVTDINNNTSTCTSTVTVQDLVAPVALCKNATVSLDNAGSGSITVSNINNGSSDACGIATTVLSNSSFTCANVGANSVTLTVTDVNGNSNTCSATVTVQDLVAPTAICKNITVQLNAAGTASITGADVNNNSTDNCGVASTSVSPNAFNCNNLLGAVPTELFISEYVEGSSNIKYLEIYNGTTGSVNLGNYTLRTYANGSATVTSSNVLSGSLASGAVVVYKNSAATGYSGPATALGMMTFNGNDAVALFNNATSKFCDIIGNIGDDPGSAWSASGLSTVDRTLRRKSTITQGITVDPTGSGVGSFTSLASEWDGFATDDVSGLGSHSVIAGGNNPVILTVTDVNGNTSICTAIVKVEDKVAPVATCQNVTVQLNSAGNGSTTAAAVNNGSSDACGVASLSLSTTSFGCANVGANSVVLTVTDVNGNSSTCGATVTVEDKVAPVAICQNVTVQLNSAGNGSTTPAAVNNGSTDACGVASLSLSTTSFNCTNVGANAVVLTVTDVNGNSSTCGATVTVQDNIAPTITCNTDVNVSNDAGLCSAVVNYSNSSTDNCSGQVITQTGGLPSGSAFPKGTTTNSFKVTDASGNTATCSFTVTVNDTENPTITCNANVNVSNDAGLCSAVVNYSNSSTDNCAGQVITQTAGLPSGSAFPKGTTTNSFTVTDASGNTATCSFTVTVNDTEDPTITCPAPVSVNNDLGVCGASVNYSIGSTDNCTGQIVTQTGGLASGSTFPVGTTTNSYTVTDVSGNTATCSFTVSVTDTENPIITCPADVVIYCQDPDGVAATGNATATDNCGSVTITSSDINNQDPDINSPGHYQYTIHRTFTATDLYGNSSSCTQTITHSGTGPVVQSVNYTGYLDNTGTLIVYPSDINNGSTDPCGPLSFLISHSPPGPFLTFTCADVGIPQNVRLVAINNVNDTFYVPAVVTVLDAIAPTITCNANVNVSNDAGLCSAVVNYSNSSTDNCSGQVITQTGGLPSASAFPKGTTTNSFTVTQAATPRPCSFTVTVNDTENPTIHL
ncbi:MAG: HYR domain-containing protein [Chitinophagales bacterium]